MKKSIDNYKYIAKMDLPFHIKKYDVLVCVNGRFYNEKDLTIEVPFNCSLETNFFTPKLIYVQKYVKDTPFRFLSNDIKLSDSSNVQRKFNKNTVLYYVEETDKNFTFKCESGKTYIIDKTKVKRYLVETKKYHFINSSGVVSHTFYDIDKNADIYRLKSGNIFEDSTDANKRLREILSK